jgi:SAM-dependent methyltransferase
VTPRQRWLAAVWPFVAAHLPRRPARVLEIGCGPTGGFVPNLHALGHRALGIDPQAPQGAHYRRTEFERHSPAHAVDVVVACTSLHHVADLDGVLDQVADTLAPAGTLVVVEWAWELFDEATAQWCFCRLPASHPADDPGWLREHRDRWVGSEQSWTDYRTGWATGEGLHTGHEIRQALQARFNTRMCVPAPYFFAELDNVTEADERAAIDAGQIRATGLHYVGVVP